MKTLTVLKDKFYMCIKIISLIHFHSLFPICSTTVSIFQITQSNPYHYIVAAVVQSVRHVWLFATPWTAHTRLPSPSTPGACSNSCLFNQWCHRTIESSVVRFSSCLQSFPASGSFLMSHLFTLSGQSIGASVLASFPLMNIQDGFPLVLTSLISLQSKGLSRVFSNNTVQKHQFFGIQLSHLFMTSHFSEMSCDKLISCFPESQQAAAFAKWMWPEITCITSRRGATGSE